MRALKFALPAALLALSWTAFGAPATLRFHGYAYDLKTSRYLYTEVHEQKIEGERWLGGSITYIAPDGSLIGKKTMDFTQDPFIPVYRLELKPGGGYVEGISAIGADRIEMYKKGYKDSAEQRETVKRPEATAADSGFHSYIRAHFAELMSGKKVRFNFGVAGNLDVYKFRARRIEDGTFENKLVARFRVEPDTLLRLLVDALELSYDTEQRKLLEYHGVSNLHDPSTGDAYDVRIIYPSTPPADAPKLPPEFQ